MRLCSPRVFLALCLFAISSVAHAQASACQTEVRHIQLDPSTASAAEICISPNLSTTVLFDRKLVAESVVLEGRERFRRVEVTGSLLVLIPSEQLASGERLRLEVHFAEGEVPRTAAFVLVVRRNQAERQVEVSRSLPAASACQGELQRKEDALQRCLAQRGSSPPSLAALLAEGLLDSRGVTTVPVNLQNLTLTSEDDLSVLDLAVYRSWRRTTVALEVSSTGPVQPWLMGGATLRGRSGSTQEVLVMLQAQPVTPGRSSMIWVEFDQLQGSPHESFTLELWNAGRSSTLTIHGLRLREP